MGSSILPSWSRVASMAHLAVILHLSQQPNHGLAHAPTCGRRPITGSAPLAADDEEAEGGRPGGLDPVDQTGGRL